MKPSDVSSMIGVSSVTIRKWSNEFASYLSPTGAGGDGRHRDFTETDVRVLKVIKELRDGGRTRRDIETALETAIAQGTINDVPLPDGSLRTAKVPMIPTAAADAALNMSNSSLLREIAFLEARIQEMKDERAAIEAQMKEERFEREKLLREIGQSRSDLLREINEAQSALAAANAELDLWRKGRIKAE